MTDFEKRKKEAKEYKKALGKRCTEIRQSLDLSQSDVANDLGYTRQSINNFEKGKTWSYVILTWYLDRGLKL